MPSAQEGSRAHTMPDSSASEKITRPSGRSRFAMRVRAFQRYAWTLITMPNLMERCLRVAKRELGANGVRGLLGYTRRLLVSGATPYEADEFYRAWIEECEALTDIDRAAIGRHIAAMAYKPLISVVVPVYNTAEEPLRAMVASVQAQLYPHWELCLADDASPSPHVVRVLAELAAADPRIRWMRREKNGHICAASNSALELATGEFVALVDHDDLLPEHALYEIVAELNAHPDTDLVYSDEDKLDEDGLRYGPYFKPDFSPDLLLGQNMISHFGVYRTSVLRAIGGFREGYEGSQDYDLALRVVQYSGATRVRHIPAILYHWRQERKGGSFSQSQLDKCVAVARRSIQDYLDATTSHANTSLHGVARGAVVANPLISTWSRVKWDLPAPPPLVSVIIPVTGRFELARASVQQLLNKANYPNLEILLVDQGGEQVVLSDDSRVRAVALPSDLTAPALMNAAARLAQGEVLLWLAPEVEGIGADWLTEMVSQVMRPDVGVVGAKLLFKDGHVQHAGMRLGAVVDAKDAAFGLGIAQPLGYRHRRTDVGYFGQLALARDVSAVTDACLAVRREVWNAVDGMDERHLKGAFLDVDFCLRVQEAHYRVLWTPFAELFYRGSPVHGSALFSVSNSDILADGQYMRQRWGRYLAADRFYNVNFDACGADFMLAKFRRRAYPWLPWAEGGKVEKSVSL